MKGESSLNKVIFLLLASSRFDETGYDPLSFVSVLGNNGLTEVNWSVASSIVFPSVCS